MESISFYADSPGAFYVYTSLFSTLILHTLDFYSSKGMYVISLLFVAELIDAFPFLDREVIIISLLFLTVIELKTLLLFLLFVLEQWTLTD